MHMYDASGLRGRIVEHEAASQVHADPCEGALHGKIRIVVAIFKTARGSKACVQW